MRDLVVLGTGGVGRAVRFFIDEINADRPRWRLLGFLDDDSDLQGRHVHGVPVLGGRDWLAGRAECQVAICLGDPVARKRAFEGLSRQGGGWEATIVHPRACLAANVSVGAGSIIYPGACVDPDVTIGRAVILNKNTSIGHDTRIGDYVTLAPGVCVGGNVEIGEGCSLGIGSSTIQGIRIREWTVVGAGAAVVFDLPDRVTAVGVPARPLPGPRQRA